ncbi:hypothetical protein EJ06DRAFT_554512 [Trichodelitschia bisporula]|uniref:Uncharacterized protein n=1 Tax=Trichodelitschia bisporula TaxID=703511 RepID=A0A6G1I452_9PEZI|nr:hypothetical protein EJ06DRAFT_554512 [Trichodelitschia bisporula]
MLPLRRLHLRNSTLVKHPRSLPKRHTSTSPPKPSTSTSASTSPASTSTPHPRLHRLNQRLSPRLQTYTTPLLSAPLSHITAFLLLHELTALTPLILLATLFHYTHPPSLLISTGWVAEGIERFGAYFRRKGWVGEGGWFGTGEKGMRIVVEVAAAWAVVKALLPVRLAVSVWGTPWFARVVVGPVGRGVKRVFRRGR